jgi:TolA-binding protein
VSGQVFSQQARTLEPARAKRKVPEGLNFAHGLFRQRKFDMAADEYRRFLASGPVPQDAADAQFGLANALLFQARYKEAKQAFDDFLHRTPNDPRVRTAWYRSGELAYMLGDLPAARKALDVFVREASGHPNLETAWAYLGDVCLGLEDFPASRTAYQRSLADFPTGQLANRSRYGLARALADLGEIDLAIKVLTELVAQGNSEWIDKALLQLGKTQFSSGRYAAAVASLESLDQMAPRSASRAEGHLVRSEALTRLDRSDEAEKLLEALVDEGSDSVAPRAALALGTLELARGHADRALETLNVAKKHFPQSPLVPAFLFRSAEALARQGRASEANKMFLKVVESYPQDPWADDALARAAQLALDAGNHASALSLSRSFPDRFPQSKFTAEVRLVEARALLAGGQAREAVERLESLIGQPQSLGAGQTPAPTPLAAASIARARYALALAYLATGRTEQADTILASLAGSSQEPVSADAQFLIGQEAVERGRFADAIGPLGRYVSANPSGQVADSALAHLATAELGLLHPDQARKYLEQLAVRFPHSKALPPTRLRVAEAALAACQPERAAEQFQLLLRTESDKTIATASSAKPAVAPLDTAVLARARLGLGRAFWRLGEPGKAATLFAEYLSSAGGGPDTLAVALEHAGALAAAGSKTDSLASYAHVIEHYPGTRESLQAELARARLLARSEKPQEASRILNDLLSSKQKRLGLESLGEKLEDILAERGWALVDAGKMAEADAVFGELMRTYPHSPRAVDARFNLAESSSEAGNHPEVVRLLAPIAVTAKQRASSTNERLMPLILYRLGRSQVEIGDWTAAGMTLDRLIKEYPESSRIRETRFLRAEAALRQGHAEQAEPMFAALAAEPASPADPDGLDRVIRGRYVQSLVGMKRWADALARADALKAELPAGDPTIADLDFARGRAFLGLARPDDARSALQAVIDARQAGELAAQAHLLRGETYFHEDRLREALTEFLKVDMLYHAPRWQAAALLEAGKVYERLSQWSDAAETYEGLRTRFPDDPLAPEAKVRLITVRERETRRGNSAG